MQNESLCNELLQAASRLYHKLTDILDDVYGQGVSTESAATAIHTSCKPADTDQSELSKEFVSRHCGDSLDNLHVSCFSWPCTDPGCMAISLGVAGYTR